MVCLPLVPMERANLLTPPPVTTVVVPPRVLLVHAPSSTTL